MTAFKNLRKFLGNWTLRQKVRQISRNKRIHNFTTASKAGLIFSCTTEEEFLAIKDFKKFLESNKINTSVLGFINSKQIPDHFLLRTGFNFFCLKNLNWYYRPESQAVIDFMNTKFDILFDFSLEYYFPLHYIVTLSPAEYKVGRLIPTEEFDLMVDITKDKRVAYLTEQVKYYLGMIQSKRVEK